MAKVLLVDTNVSSYPIYKYLIENKYDVYVTGSNPEDFLAKHSKNYIHLDYSDIKKLDSLIKELKFDYVVPGCNDVSYNSCVEINHDNKFPGIENKSNNETLNNKQIYRCFATKNKLPSPKIYTADNIKPIHFPIIIKPTDAFSGRGVNILYKKDIKNLSFAIHEAKKNSRKGQYIIEKFIPGQLYSHSAFISNANIVADVIVEEHCTANPFAVDTSRVIQNFSKILLEKVRESAKKTAKLLNLKDGLLHTQFICKNKSIWLIETTRRCPGDLYSRLIEMSTGLNYAENYTRPFLGLKYKFKNNLKSKSFIMRHTITEKEGGHYWTLRFPKAVKVQEFISLSLSGDIIKPAPASRIGIVFISCDTPKEFSSAYKKAIARKLYSTTY